MKPLRFMCSITDNKISRRRRRLCSMILLCLPKWYCPHRNLHICHVIWSQRTNRTSRHPTLVLESRDGPHHLHEWKGRFVTHHSDFLYGGLFEWRHDVVEQTQNFPVLPPGGSGVNWRGYIWKENSIQILNKRSIIFIVLTIFIVSKNFYRQTQFKGLETLAQVLFWQSLLSMFGVR